MSTTIAGVPRLAGPPPEKFRRDDDYLQGKADGLKLAAQVCRGLAHLETSCSEVNNVDRARAAATFDCAIVLDNMARQTRVRA